MIITVIIIMEAISTINTIAQIIKEIMKVSIIVITNKSTKATLKLKVNILLNIKINKAQTMIINIKTSHNININNKTLHNITLKSIEIRIIIKIQVIMIINKLRIITEHNILIQMIILHKFIMKISKNLINNNPTVLLNKLNNMYNTIKTIQIQYQIIEVLFIIIIRESKNN